MGMALRVRDWFDRRFLHDFFFGMRIIQGQG
jgi:hypothetical protein